MHLTLCQTSMMERFAKIGPKFIHCFRKKLPKNRTIILSLIILRINMLNPKAVDHFVKNRSSRPEVFCKKEVLKNFAILTGERTPVPEPLF